MNRRAFLSHGRSSRRDRDTASMALSFTGALDFTSPLRSGEGPSGRR